MTDQQIAQGVGPTPIAEIVQGSQQLLPKLAFASYDGSGAAGDFLPVVKFIGPSGLLAGQAVGDVVTAGASVDQTWFRGLTKQGGAGGGGIQFDVDNVGDWLNIETTSYESAPPYYGINLHAAGAAVNIEGDDALFLAGAVSTWQFASLRLEYGSDINIVDAVLNVGGSPGSPNPVPYLYLNGSKLSFFGADVVPQQPTPSTLADVIALLQAYGLSA